MIIQNTFERYELKYIITKQQERKLKECMAAYMKEDAYGKSTINNIYYDTNDSLLARRSLERPIYKEKLRVRSYGTAQSGSQVYVELKKKFKGVVYKRRVPMTVDLSEKYLLGLAQAPACQIISEINYFLQYYKTIAPAIFLSYDREAYYSVSDESFRMTFDENIRHRNYDLSLTKSGGELILPRNNVLLEVKTALGLPMWLINFFSENQIYKTSFSKYGHAYKLLQASTTGGCNNVA